MYYIGYIDFVETVSWWFIPLLEIYQWYIDTTYTLSILAPTCQAPHTPSHGLFRMAIPAELCGIQEHQCLLSLHPSDSCKTNTTQTTSQYLIRLTQNKVC